MSNGKLVAGAVAGLMVAFLLCAYGADVFTQYGYGAKASATSSAARIDLTGRSNYTYNVSVYNGGTGDVYLGVNCSILQFTGMVMNTTNGIPVPSGQTYTFTPPQYAGGKQMKIDSFCYQTLDAALTCDLYVAMF